MGLGEMTRSCSITSMMRGADDDETIDHRPLPSKNLDEAHWSEFTAEQKIAANTGSFTFLAGV